MKKLLTLALLGMFAAAPAAFAQSANDQDIKSDVGAINKDNTALQKDQENLDANRAAKAQDKAEGNAGKQAVDSVKIGANHTAIAEKKAEKKADKGVLRHHKKKVKTDNGDAGTSTAQ